MRRYIIFTLLTISLALLVFPQREVSSATDYNKSSLAADQVKANTLIETMKVTEVLEVLGPLAPVALSPFFGITCLSATSMLSEKGVLPENRFLSGNKALNNPAVFLAFLALTIATSIPKLTTVTKAFAEVTDQAETYAGIVSYLVIFALAASSSDDSGQQVVYSAGIITFTKQTLLMAACVINIIVINTVKFFFELLAMISPIPTLDAIFEASNKAVAAGLAIIYAFSPAVAFAINFVLFLICLSIFTWAHRRIRFYQSILLGPAAMAIKKKMFNLSGDPNAGLQPRVANRIKNADLIIKAFPAKRFGKLKTKTSCCLVRSDEQLLLVRLRWFRSPIIETIDESNLKIAIERGILSNSVNFMSQDGKIACKLMFSKVYNEMLDKIAADLNTDAT